MYKSILQPLLFNLDPEKAHHLTTGLFKTLLTIPGAKSISRMVYDLKDPRLEKEVMGLKFRNQIGLAAGFDKNADFMHEMETLGFGFLEVGTITPKGQPGNPKPRMFRLKKDRALINRLGFNNDGLDAAIRNLEKRPDNIIIGGNIGKNKVTPNEEAYRDYEICLEGLYPYVDYFVVNVSSPNTPGLRELQDKEPLRDLLSRLKDRISGKKIEKPLLLKIAPDLTEGQLDDIIELMDELKMSGIIATNTSLTRAGLKSESRVLEEAGGLSGAPILKMSNGIVSRLRNALPELPIIGVGGINGPESALDKIESGADLVQFYTGFIYEGPGLVKNIKKAIITANSN